MASTFEFHFVDKSDRPLRFDYIDFLVPFLSSEFKCVKFESFGKNRFLGHLAVQRA